MLALLASVASLGSSLFGASARRSAARANRRFANQMAADVEARGEREAEMATMALSQRQGATRAGIAAQGIDVSQGSAAEIQRQTQMYGEQDIEQIRMNAAREAWGIRTQARLNQRAEYNAATAETIGALAQFGQSDFGRTLLTRGEDAWKAFNSRRRDRMAQRAVQGIQNVSNRLYANGVFDIE